MKKSVRKPRKIRCLMAIVIVILIVSVLLGGFSARADANGLDSNRDFVPVYVVNGDTLWGLVDEYYDYQGDIRKAIYEVEKINSLDGSELQVGQVVYIPLK